MLRALFPAEPSGDSLRFTNRVNALSPNRAVRMQTASRRFSTRSRALRIITQEYKSNHQSIKINFIGKRQNTPKLYFGDEWRVGLEAAAAASLSKKTAGCRPPNTSKLCFEDRTDGLFYVLLLYPVHVCSGQYENRLVRHPLLLPLNISIYGIEGGLECCVSVDSARDELIFFLIQ